MAAADQNTLDFYVGKTIRLFTKTGFAFFGTIKSVGPEFITFSNDKNEVSLISRDSIERIQPDAEVYK
jgi:hypothetical protein